MLWQCLCDSSNAYSSRAAVCQCRTGAQVGVGSAGDRVEILLLTNPELELGFASSRCPAGGCNGDGGTDLGMDPQQRSQPDTQPQGVLGSELTSALRGWPGCSRTPPAPSHAGGVPVGESLP